MGTYFEFNSVDQFRWDYDVCVLDAAAKLQCDQGGNNFVLTNVVQLALRGTPQ